MNIGSSMLELILANTQDLYQKYGSPDNISEGGLVTIKPGLTVHIRNLLDGTIQYVFSISRDGHIHISYSYPAINIIISATYSKIGALAEFYYKEGHWTVTDGAPHQTKERTAAIPAWLVGEIEWALA